MVFPFTIGDELLATEADLMSQRNRLQLVAGESIDASSTPQVIYIQNSSGKVIKADADADESAFSYAGFVANGQNVVLDDNVNISIGFITGFSSLTIGAPQYISSTAGAITETKPSDRSVEIGIAVSATTILAYPHNARLNSATATSSATSDDVQTKTIGFRPRLIIALSKASNSVDTNSGFGVGFFTESLGNVWYGNKGQSTANQVLETGFLCRAVASGNFFEIKVENVTDTGFDIDFDYTGAGGSAGTSTVHYVAIG